MEDERGRIIYLKVSKSKLRLSVYLRVFVDKFYRKFHEMMIMDELKSDLDNLNVEIENLKSEIRIAQMQAEYNIKPLNQQLLKLKEDKRNFASKNDFESVQNCRRKESNLKFKINAQWSRHSMLKDELFRLNKTKTELEKKIKLENDKIKRNEKILAKMDNVLKNYRKTQNLKLASIDSNINPNHVAQWLKWGKNDFSETYSYFYEKISEIDEYFRDLESQKLKNQMDSVIEAYKKTDSLEKSSKLVGVSYDTVKYWYEWGSRGFGKENTYFFNKINNYH